MLEDSENVSSDHLRQKMANPAAKNRFFHFRHAVFSLHHSHPYNYKYESPTVLRWQEGNEEDLFCNIWQDFVIQLKQRKQCSGGARQWNRKLSFYCKTCTDLQ